jgi:hypothetical protein
MSRANSVRGRWVNHIRKKPNPTRTTSRHSPSGAALGVDPFAQPQPFAFGIDTSPASASDGAASSIPSSVPGSNYTSPLDFSGTTSLDFNSSVMSMAGDALSPEAMGSHYTYPGSGAMTGLLGNGMGGLSNALDPQVDVNEFLAFLGSGAEAMSDPSVASSSSDYRRPSTSGMSTAGMSTSGMSGI